MAFISPCGYGDFGLLSIAQDLASLYLPDTPLTDIPNVATHRQGLDKSTKR
jgi:hypothetical protein